MGVPHVISFRIFNHVHLLESCYTLRISPNRTRHGPIDLPVSLVTFCMNISQEETADMVASLNSASEFEILLY